MDHPDDDVLADHSEETKDVPQAILKCPLIIFVSLLLVFEEVQVILLELSKREAIANQEWYIDAKSLVDVECNAYLFAILLKSHLEDD